MQLPSSSCSSVPLDPASGSSLGPRLSQTSEGPSSSRQMRQSPRCRSTPPARSSSGTGALWGRSCPCGTRGSRWAAHGNQQQAACLAIFLRWWQLLEPAACCLPACTCWLPARNLAMAAAAVCCAGPGHIVGVHQARSAPRSYPPQCKACWAFAATAAIESKLLIAAGLDAASSALDLSEQQVGSVAWLAAIACPCLSGSPPVKLAPAVHTSSQSASRRCRMAGSETGLLGASWIRRPFKPQSRTRRLLPTPATLAADRLCQQGAGLYQHWLQGRRPA
mgnify:CR=1 FL=1